MNDIPKCLFPRCEKKQFARGLCRICYQTARSLVIRGKTTWLELETKGKTLPVRNGKKGGISEWLKAL